MSVLIAATLITWLFTAAAYAVAVAIALLLAPFHLLRWLFFRGLGGAVMCGVALKGSPARSPKSAISPMSPLNQLLFNLGRVVRRLAANIEPPPETPREPPMRQPSPQQHPYFEEAERLFAAWLDRRPEGGPLVQRTFEFDYAPEPYLVFGEEPRLVFLSTNPGGALDVQKHPDVEPGSIFRRRTTYAETAAMLGRYYADPNGPINASARAKNAAMSRIAALLGYRGVVQIEGLPWHSPNLVKARMEQVATEDLVARRYTRVLSDYLDTQAVVLSFCAGTPEAERNAGVDIKARLLGLDVRSAVMTPLKRSKTGRLSQALFCARRDGRVRGLFVNQGSDSLPAKSDVTDAAIIAAVRGNR